MNKFKIEVDAKPSGDGDEVFGNDDPAEGVTEQTETDQTDQQAEIEATETDQETDQTETDETDQTGSETETDQTDQTDQPAQTMVPLSALQQSRAKVKELREKVQQYQQPTNNQQPTETHQQTADDLTDPTLPAADGDPFANLENDDGVTVQEIRDREAYVNEQQVIAQREAWQAEAMVAEADALVLFSAEQVGEGLDYKTVGAIGEVNLSAADNAEIMNMPPAKAPAEYYKRCIARTPELAELQRMTQAQSDQTQRQPKVKLTDQQRRKLPNKPLKEQLESDTDVELGQADDSAVNEIFNHLYA